ncbi:beta-lactamase class A [Blastococcus xanthinilyticus]|uniref:Beta-lactamase class A n=1 Tax=Blastococcus xanthinilyticus TaxID=1564164 RepID=A0A5S5CXS9_9ACTN|nr:beta-lactamase class A [Blastococcus xanthinilyticus]
MPGTGPHQHVNGIRVAACVQRLGDGAEIGAGADEVVPLASVGKVLLLAEVARRVDAGALDSGERLPLLPGDRAVGGTGLLARLSPTDWSVQDLVTAVASVSDNAATNVLLRAVGLGSVQETARAAGLVRTTVHDVIRAHRGPGTAPQFASGTVRELAGLLRDVALDRFVSPRASQLLRGWLALNVDRSLVADGITRGGNRPVVVNKTGTDVGVLADVGITRGLACVVYAVVATFPPGAEGSAVDALRHAGSVVRDLALAGPGPSPDPGHRRPISRDS